MYSNEGCVCVVPHTVIDTHIQLFATFLAHLLKIHPFRQTLTAPFYSAHLKKNNNPEVRHNYRPRVLNNVHP
jgi:hypothetical protein